MRKGRINEEGGTYKDEENNYAKEKEVNWGGGDTRMKRGYIEEEDWGQGRRHAEEEEEEVTGSEKMGYK